MTWKEEVRRELLRYQEETDSNKVTLQEFYQFSEDRLSASYPNNNHVQAKIRQILQRLRDDGEIRFVDGRGNYSTGADASHNKQTAANNHGDTSANDKRQTAADVDEIAILDQIESEFEHI